MAEQAAPKRPQTAYFLWLGENRAAVVEALGGSQKGSEVSKKAGEMWKALSAEQRAPYEQRFKEAKEAFDAQKPAKPAKEPQEGEEVRKRPMTPVFAFIQAKRAEINAMGVTALGAVSKKGTEMFKALPAEEQAQWQQRFEEQMKEYKAWAEGEGQAAVAAKKGAAKEKKAAKAAVAEKKAAKVARKEARAGGAEAEAGEAEAETAEAAEGGEAEAKPVVAKPKGKAEAKAAPKAAGKRKAEAESAEGEPSAKAAKGKGGGKAKAEEPAVAAAVLKQAAALGEAASGISYTSLLEKLVGTAGVQGKVSDADALAALKKHGGLLNKARAELRAMAGA